MTLEIVLMWAAVTMYAAGSVLLSVGIIFGRSRLERLGVWVSLAGLAPHLAATAVRWVRVGHPPFLGFYEVVSGLALVTVLFYGVLAVRSRTLVVTGIIIMPLAFLSTAAAMFAPKADLAVTGTLASWWLVVHISFAKLAYGAFVVACALAILYLFGERLDPTRYRRLLELLPSQESLDDLSYRCIAAGFVFLGVMIASGAVWANEAWGRYWGWDPIESWSAISWLVYAVYLHLRLTMGWRGRKAAWFAIIALAVVVFALIGVPLLYNSVHAAYMKGT